MSPAITRAKRARAAETTLTSEELAFEQSLREAEEEKAKRALAAKRAGNAREPRERESRASRRSPRRLARGDSRGVRRPRGEFAVSFRGGTRARVGDASASCSFASRRFHAKSTDDDASLTRNFETRDASGRRARQDDGGTRTRGYRGGAEIQSAGDSRRGASRRRGRGGEGGGGGRGARAAARKAATAKPTPFGLGRKRDANHTDDDDAKRDAKRAKLGDAAPPPPTMPVSPRFATTKRAILRAPYPPIVAAEDASRAASASAASASASAATPLATAWTA